MGTTLSDGVLLRTHSKQILFLMSMTCLSSYDKVNWCVTQNTATPPQANSSTVVRLQQVVASEISLVGSTGARLPNTCDRKTAERLNAKKIWDEDHDAAILEEIGTGEKVLIMMRKHHLVMHLGMDHHHQKRMAAIKSRIVSSHRN